MRPKSTGVAFVTAAAVGAAGVAFVAGGATSPQSAAAKSGPAQGHSSDGSMMGGDGASMPTAMMDGERAQMMRDPGMRRLERRAMRGLPAMARMMHEHMEG